MAAVTDARPPKLRSRPRLRALAAAPPEEVADGVWVVRGGLLRTMNVYATSAVNSPGSRLREGRSRPSNSGIEGLVLQGAAGLKLAKAGGVVAGDAVFVLLTGVCAIGIGSRTCRRDATVAFGQTGVAWLSLAQAS